MICTNELAALKCNKRAILEPLVVAIAPYAPHIAEELWHLLGHAESVTGATSLNGKKNTWWKIALNIRFLSTVKYVSN